MPASPSSETAGMVQVNVDMFRYLDTQLGLKRE